MCMCVVKGIQYVCPNVWTELLGSYKYNSWSNSKFTTFVCPTISYGELFIFQIPLHPELH